MEAAARQGRRRRRRIRPEIKWAIYVFILVLAAEFVVLPRLGGFSKSLHQVSHINLAYVLAGIALEAASLVAYAELTRTVLPGQTRLRRVLRIDLSSLALSHVVPGGTAPGAALSYRLLTQSGVRTADAGFALAMQGVGSAAVLNVLFWAALVVSLFLHPYNPLYTLAAGAGVLMMAAFAGVVVALTRGRQHTLEAARRLADRLPFLDGDQLAAGLGRFGERLRTLAADRRLLVRAIAWAAANWLLDASSLWVFVAAFHRYLSPVDLLVAYGLANILAVIPITPAGLGVVDATLAATLIGFGIPGTITGPAVLGYRLVNFWLPIPVGGFAYLGLRFPGEGWRSRLARAREEVSETSGPTGHETSGPTGHETSGPAGHELGRHRADGAQTGRSDEPGTAEGPPAPKSPTTDGPVAPGERTTDASGRARELDGDGDAGPGHTNGSGPSRSRRAVEPGPP